jgi:hypothetical protein
MAKLEASLMKEGTVNEPPPASAFRPR